jgi:hypothetical protein
VHQPAQLRAPSNPIRLTKALQVFWKTLLWSYGNLITWGIEAFAALVAALVLPQWSLPELKALEICCNALLRLGSANSSHLFPIRIYSRFAFVTQL